MTDETRRGLGCLPEPPNAVSPHSFEEVVGDGYMRMQRFLSLEWCVDGIRDQARAPCCCGFGVSQTLQNCARQRIASEHPGQDKWISFTVPSALHIYVQSLCTSGRLGTDKGTTIFDALTAIEKGGFIPESKVPYEPARRFEELWVDELQGALMQKGLKYHWLQDGDPTVAQEKLQYALCAGRGVVVGIEVDDTCEQNRGEIWPGPTGVRLGGHCMSLLDYPDGMPRLVNSWGPLYGRNGYLTTTWDVICAARSIWIIDFVPDYQIG